MRLLPPGVDETSHSTETHSTNDEPKKVVEAAAAKMIPSAPAQFEKVILKEILAQRKSITNPKFVVTPSIHSHI